MTFRKCLAAMAALAALLLATVAGLNQLGRPDHAVTGYAQAQVQLPGEAAPSSVHIWYPALTGPVSRVGDSALFWGFAAQVEAAPLPGRHPMILFSHGSGGRALRHAGLLSGLAAAGYVVVAPDHPGSTSGDSDPAITLDLSRRPAHLSYLIDWVLAERPLNITIDPEHIGAMGFSMGAFTVLSLSGVQADAAALATYCTQNPAMSDCQWYAAGGINLTRIDAATFGGTFIDPRIQAVLAIDPALPRAVNTGSLSAPQVPIAVVNMRNATIPVGLDWSSHVAAIPGATWAVLDGASHFSAMDPCRLIGRIVIGLAAGGEGICADAMPTPRRATNAALNLMAVAFFQRQLSR